jgi:AcrR family transcriptional regulator
MRSNTTRRTQRGEPSLSRERIIDAAIALLDTEGEGGLTFRALSERLATGAGAIYWHVANKDDLLNAACDAIVTATLAGVDADSPSGATPQARIRAIGLAMFDTIDAHPWVGAELARASWKMPMVRILESLGRQVGALGVAAPVVGVATTTLLSYILGVAGQNAANAQIARAQQLVRETFLASVASDWAALDADQFPFTRSLAEHLRDHDDRNDFAAGIDLILQGLR